MERTCVHQSQSVVRTSFKFSMREVCCSGTVHRLRTSQLYNSVYIRTYTFLLSRTNLIIDVGISMFFLYFFRRKYRDFHTVSLAGLEPGLEPSPRVLVAETKSESESLMSESESETESFKIGLETGLETETGLESSNTD